MTSQRQELTTLLSEVSQDALQLGEEDAKYEVTTYTSPVEIEKYCILNRIDVLFTVRRGQCTAGRYLQDVPHREITDYTVGVWCIYTDGSRTADYQSLRDAAVAEVQRLLKANPSVAREKNLQGDDDHRHGAVYILNTNLTVSKKTYS